MNLSKHDLVFAAVRIVGLLCIVRAILALPELGLAMWLNSSEITAVGLASLSLHLLVGGALFFYAPAIEASIAGIDANAKRYRERKQAEAEELAARPRKPTSETVRNSVRKRRSRVQRRKA